MEPEVGILTSRSAAIGIAQKLRWHSIPGDRIHLLLPSGPHAEDAMPIDDTEQPGVGQAVGGAVGWASAELSLGAGRRESPGARRVGAVTAVGLAARPCSARRHRTGRGSGRCARGEDPRGLAAARGLPLSGCVVAWALDRLRRSGDRRQRTRRNWLARSWWSPGRSRWTRRVVGGNPGRREGALRQRGPLRVGGGGIPSRIRGRIASGGAGHRRFLPHRCIAPPSGRGRRIRRLSPRIRAGAAVRREGVGKKPDPRRIDRRGPRRPLPRPPGRPVESSARATLARRMPPPAPDPPECDRRRSRIRCVCTGPSRSAPPE